MEKIDIKKHYSDALYWATSPKSKDKDYHITRLQESILRKLIHYSKPRMKLQQKITYSNAIIAEHTFLKEETLSKVIPKLSRLGFISTASIRIFDEGKHKTRRTIYIKWDKLESILSEVPIKEKQKEELPQSGTAQENANLPSKKQHKEGVALSANTEDNSKNDSRVLEKKNQEIPRIIVTDEKLNWTNKQSMNGSITKEEFELLGQEKLEYIFYGKEGIWKVDEFNLENKYLLRQFYKGGDECILSNLNVKDAYIRLNIQELNDYLEYKRIGFGDLTPDIFKHIQNNGLPKGKP